MAKATTIQEDNARLSFFKNDLGKKPALQKAFEKIYTDKKGDWTAINKALKKNKSFTAPVVRNLAFTHDLANWTADNESLVGLFQNNKETNSMRDIALTLNKKEFKKLLPAKAIPKGETRTTYGDKLYNGLYGSEPTAVITNLILDPAIPLLNDKTGAFISSLLLKYPEFNIKTTSVYELIKKKDTFKDLSVDEKVLAIKDLKSLQRITSISPVPEAVPVLLNKNYGSSYSITQLPPDQFIANLKDSDLPEETLAYIYNQAGKKKIFYENFLITIKEAGEKTGIKMIDGDAAGRRDPNTTNYIDKEVEEILTKNNLSWDLLFGDADYCECDECSSVHSPAAYYVDLLQYLRNNNLDPDYERKGPLDISGTPLKVLFARRPDLAHLELTCKNTNTVLPYVDLVNEVMEQYIAFKLKEEDFKNYKGFNVDDETSGELLAAPRHTEQEKAYQVLQTATFPFSLPYHQPIDAARIFLNHLNSSRYEVINTFRSNNADINFDIAADAEYLGLTEEEYCIVTKEFFNGANDYHNTDEYYGLKDVTAWQQKLSQVKNEFLPRTGIFYNDLIELLKTVYLNPYLPKGENLTILRILLLTDRYTDVLKHYAEDEMDYFFQNPDLSEFFNGKNYGQPVRVQKLTDFFAITPKSIVLESPGNNCTLDGVKLIHLDGTPLTENEYDKMQRFIRLRNKLGFTTKETDKAIMTLGAGDITPALIHQLVAAKKVLSLTGIELTRLLCFWGDIGTTGENSLYKRLFLSHNLLAIDDIFKSDNNTGAYLSGTPQTIASHLPAVMTALNLSADDIASIKIFKSLPEQLMLTIENLSLLYRYRLLSKTLGLRIPAFIKLLELFGDVFEDSDTTLQFLQNLTRIEDAGFTIDQLSYVINGLDSNTKSLVPTKKEVIVLAKKLVDGQNKIESEQADLTADNTATTDAEKLESLRNKATSELVRSKASLLYDSDMVEKIISILEGTTLYNTKAPLISAVPVFPVNLQKKVRYIKTIAPLTPLDPGTTTYSLQVTGALTEIELLQLERLVPNSRDWTESVGEIEKQQTALYNDLLSGIFAANLSEADVIKLENNSTSAPAKHMAFLKVFLPYLREKLKDKHLVNTLSEQIGLDKSLVHELIFNILESDGFSLYEKLSSPIELPVPAATELSWYGKLIPASDDDFTFIVRTSEDRSFKISLDNQILIDNPGRQGTRAIDLRSAEVKLESGKVYQLSIEGIDLTELYWKTRITSVEPIPSNTLLPDFKKKATREALEQLGKMAILINGLSLSADEVNYIHTNRTDFNDIDFNDLSLKDLLRIIDYCELRNSLPRTNISLLQFWDRLSDSGTVLSEHIAKLTDWKKENIDMLISGAHYNLTKNNFKNEQNLLKLQHSLSVASKIGMDINDLFEWAIPVSDFDACKIIAGSIQNALRAKYNQTDWEQVVKPLNDQLRNNQKNALIAYLLQQQELKTANVIDADGLFEYFLIDVQMDPCMETSRIKQAISSVQLFIQRCFLGLERDNGITSELPDRTRWTWMQRYRIWEANRKVFLYPENWIESNLRDDKSPFFKELESELLQKDINKQNVTDALKTYLYKVDEVANMEVIGLYVEGLKEDDFIWERGSKLHVFSRTRSAPFFFYYRYLALDEMNWSPWEKMQVDIPSYDVTDENGHITGNGCYLTPVVWDKRLFVFFPQFSKKTKPNPKAVGNVQALAILDQSELKPIEYWEIKMAWSEYRNGKWTQKQISSSTEKQTFQTTSNVNPQLIEAQERAQNELNAALKTSNRLKRAMDIALVLLDDAEPDRGKGNASSIVGLRNRYNNKKRLYDESIIELEAAKLKLANAKEAITASPKTSVEVIGEVFLFEFVPVISDDFILLAIKIFYNNDNQELGIFEFNGNNLQVPVKTYSGNNAVRARYFHYSGMSIENSSIASLQTSGTAGYVFQRSDGAVNFDGKRFYHPYTRDLIGKINSVQLEEFFNNIALTDKADSFGAYNDDNNSNTPDSYHELKRPYSLYNWELFFHTPILIADALSKAQQFEESLKWFHYVFNPIADGEEDNRFWKFRPFKETNSKNILDKIFNDLKANQPDAAINEWRNNPFKPHVVARSRPVAYMKWVVMKYIDNILDWGDYLFRQDTIESINQATQLYVLAGHILGPKPMMIPKRGKMKAHNYLSLLDKWDASSNAMDEMEVSAIYSIQTSNNSGINVETSPTTELFGSASALYFCIPKNPKLLACWDTLADRLFKIRHCQNIEGIFRKLPLFEPPIDPALLVKASAQGLSISSVINDLNSAMPNYRFYYLLQKALELCNELKSLGGAMLSAIEKKDNESISLIRAKHEGTMNNLMMEIKKLQLEEAQKSLESLHQNRKAPEARFKYYLQLVGNDSEIPGLDTDFKELANSIEKPVDESGLRLSKFEKEDMDKANEAAGWQIAIGTTESLASLLSLFPVLAADVKPFGIGVGANFGGSNLGAAVSALARGMQTYSNHLSYESSHAAKKGGFQRALQERIMQANAAGYELKQIDKQITAQEIRINITSQEISNQQKHIDNANEVEEFLKNKYSNEELYTWMRGSLKTLYHQVYNLAYDLAKKAERTYCFERGISNAGIIQSGYFDAGREGLLAGEQLYVGLKQLEAAYQEKRGYDYEITKHISLRQLDPLTLIKLKATGKCEFDLPEVLFDMDYPGHFKRRIKSVSVSIPCIAGPYTGVNARLRLVNNKFRNSPIASNANNYPEKTDEQDDRFISYNIPITAIATSSAQNDSGMFELNFKDERYLPFEGAGVISRWRLELPGVKQFDYNTISDVILHIKYIASEGGDQLKNSATGSVSTQLNQISQELNETGLHIPISLKHDMPNEWNVLLNTGKVSIPIDKSRLPYFAKASANLSIDNTILISKVNITKLRISSNTAVNIVFNILPGMDLFKSDPISGIPLVLQGNKTINPLVEIDNTELQTLDDLVLVVKYTLA